MIKDKKTGQLQFEYKYLTNDRYGLPIDLSEKKFWDNLKSTEDFDKGIYRQRLSSIIEKASVRQESNQPSIYRDIYQSVTSANNSSEYDDDDTASLTHPNHFFFETLDLLRAIIVAYNQHKDGTSEKLAKHAFSELGLCLSQKKYEDIHQDYIALTLLHNDHIKNTMYSHFHGELKKRLRAVWDLTIDQPAIYAGKNLMNALQHLDELLVDLVDVHHNNKQAQKQERMSSDNKSSKKPLSISLNNLYFDLKATRTAISNSSSSVKAGHYVFELPDTPENRQLIVTIEELLNHSHKMDADTKKKAFEKAYRKYLYEKNKQSSAVADGDAFFRHYRLLEDYVHGASTIYEFEAEVRQELYSFARTTFDAVAQVDYIPYSFADVEFKHSRSAFAYGRLKNAHDQIRFKIHRALRLLSSTNALKFFLFDNDTAPESAITPLNYEPLSASVLFKKKVATMRNEIHLQRLRFHKEYPSIGLLYDFKPETVQSFVDRFNNRCPTVYGEEHLCYSNLTVFLTLSSYTTHPLDSLLFEASLLKYESQMIVLEEIDQTLSVLLHEYHFYSFL